MDQQFSGRVAEGGKHKKSRDREAQAEHEKYDHRRGSEHRPRAFHPQKGRPGRDHGQRDQHADGQPAKKGLEHPGIMPIYPSRRNPRSSGAALRYGSERTDSFRNVRGAGGGWRPTRTGVLLKRDYQ